MTPRHIACATLLLALTLGQSVPVHADQAADLQQMQQFIDVMQGYYTIIDRVHEISSDPDKAIIQQLQKIDELYKNRDERATSIRLMQKVYDGTPSMTVRNAVAIMLADALNETGRTDQAIALLDKSLSATLKGSPRP